MKVEQISIALMGAVKAGFDPSGLLNPGVLVDPAPRDADLRLQPAGRELFFIDAAQNMVAVAVTAGSSFEFGPPRTLFSAVDYYSPPIIRSSMCRRTGSVSCCTGTRRKRIPESSWSSIFSTS